MSTLLVRSELEKIDLILLNLEKFCMTEQINNKDKIVSLICEDYNFPYINKIFSEIILHPFIILKYLEYLSWQMLNNIGEDRIKRKTHIYKKLRKLMGKEYIRIRRFNNNGVYCGIPYIENEAGFFFWNDEPILITKFNKNQEFEQPYGFPLRQEVRIMSSIAFSLTCGAYSFNLSYDTYDIPINMLNGEWNFRVDSRVNAVIYLLDRIENNKLNRYIKYDNLRKYNFSTRGYCLENNKKFYSSFDDKDELVLRTCFMLIKAKMLFDSDRLYFEDACINLFIAIEGTLRLIYKRISNQKNFELQPTIEHINNVFPNGEYWEELLRDIYNKRIQIVHPAASKWMPELDDDDFYDNYDIAVDMLFYAITGCLLNREY